MAVLETIKTIGNLVPEIQNLRAQCHRACGDLEIVLVNLRQKFSNDLEKQQREAQKKDAQ